MHADELLDSMRALLLVVESDGTIAAARGGFGGFLGLDVEALRGDNVFTHVPASDAEELAMYFLGAVDESADTIGLPMPFRLSIVDPDGFAHPVDIIPTGQMISEDVWQWTVLLVPVALSGSITRSLDLEMAGAPRHLVRTMLCEELRVDNANYTSRWLLVDHDEPAKPSLIVARDEDRELATAVEHDLVANGWEPWTDIAAGATVSVDPSTIGASTRALMDHAGWQRVIVAPVYVQSRLVATYLLIGRVPPEYDALSVKANVAARIQTLVRATAMLLGRWNDQDQLEVAATTDPLTGLANRRELFRELRENRRDGALLFIDVDDFKLVNDSYGHAVGDVVLTTIAERIATVCRDGDRVGRVGGDEFVVLLDGAGEELAEALAGRILDWVSAPLNIDEGPASVSVSIGWSTLGVDDPLEAADHAMLAAKRGTAQRAESSALVH